MFARLFLPPRFPSVLFGRLDFWYLGFLLGYEMRPLLDSGLLQ